MNKTNPYKFGFVFYHRDIKVEDKVPEIQNWNRESINDYYLVYDPDLKIQRASSGNKKLTIIGDYFLPHRYNVTSFLEQAVKSEKNLHDFLYYACGRFLVIYQIDSEIRIYHDAFSSRSVFYTNIERIVASHAHIIANVLKLKRNTDTIEFMSRPKWKSRNVKYLPGDLTLWDNVHYLPPNNYFRLGDNNPTRFYFGKKIKNDYNYEELNLLLEEYFEALFDHISNKGFAFGLTAGTDNRLLLTYAKQFLPTEKLASYTMLRSIKNKEKKAIEELANQNDMIHAFIKQDTIQDQGLYFEKIQRASVNLVKHPYLSGIANFMIDNNKHYLLSGNGGEILRGFSLYDRISKGIPTRDASAKDLARIYEDSSPYSIKSFQPFLEKMKYSEFPENSKLSDIMYWEHRMGAWYSASALNVLSLVTNPFIAFNSRHLYHSFHNITHNFDNLFIEIVLQKNKTLSEVDYC